MEIVEIVEMIWMLSLNWLLLYPRGNCENSGNSGNYVGVMADEKALHSVEKVKLVEKVEMVFVLLVSDPTHYLVEIVVLVKIE